MVKLRLNGDSSLYYIGTNGRTFNSPMISGGQFDKIFTYYSVDPGANTIFNLFNVSDEYGNNAVGDTLYTTVQAGTPSLVVEPSDSDSIRIRVVGSWFQYKLITKTLINGAWSDYSYVDDNAYYEGVSSWKIIETTLYDNVWLFIKDPTKSYAFALRNGYGGPIIEGTEIII